MIYHFQKGAYIGGKWNQGPFTHDDASPKTAEFSGQCAINVHQSFFEGFTNSHSHCFQFAMRALAEQSSNPSDSFWTWRKIMYETANSLTIVQLKKIASQFFNLCLKKGYNHIVEFHYLHHITDNPLDSSLALIESAKDSGIGLTLIPIYYHQSNFDKPILPEQKKFFFAGPSAYLQHVQALKKFETGTLKIGYGVHSLRACPLDHFIEIHSESKGSPFHLHIAEQIQEVDDCLNFHGARPIELLLANIDFHQHLNLVHATHLEPHEVLAIAQSDARVILCPSTEANLGDGFFPIRAFLERGGSFAIGSDSHIRIDPWEELRWIDYLDRLCHKDRLGLRGTQTPHPAKVLYENAILQGQRSAGLEQKLNLNGFLFNSPGNFEDQNLSIEEKLAKLIYCGGEEYSILFDHRANC